MTIPSYINNLNQLHLTGISREHAYRGDLRSMLSAILPDILIINEPARVKCGAPDYVLTKKDIPVGYIEAKDIGVDLKSKTLKEQFDRYRAGLSNLIFTDYMDFHFYRDGVLSTTVAIAKIENGNIVGIPENYESFENLIKNFALTISQSIKSPTKLAEMMAGKAKLMADVIERSLNHDDETDTQTSLKKQMLSFKQMLIHDITNSAFADIYSQTIAYGMFAARYHDPSLENFSRQEAAELIPKSNPFLRKLFHEVAGPDLDDRLVWMVDELVNIFLATDVAVIMKNFGKGTKQEDPVVHFYETFLASYNPALRKARGVWYTPQPVVNFIVRAVDDILKTEFNLPAGLADTSKIKVKTKTVTKATTDKRSKLKEVEVEHEVHKVQILDPATGTGTFLAEVVKHIYKKFEGQQGIWSNYVNQHLIPRLNGFELLMASYAMAHLKMDMLLTETGYKATSDQRFRIFLTNSLEEAHPDTGTLFSSWLSDEADQANAIKRETPVMVIMGNPPYSGESSNKSDWIMQLMEDYKKEPGGKEKLKERNPKWINDDYVKFMRFGQHFIEKNGSGVLAFINPHGFLDNPTFRGMRWNLLKTYDKIYTIDLHGNSKKKEVSPDGTPDVNVFDIEQGVSINICIKTGSKKLEELGKVFHFDLFGKREIKYNYLMNNSIKTILFKELPNIAPNFYFVHKNFSQQESYNVGFSINKLFILNNAGIVTANDKVLIDDDCEKLLKKIANHYSIELNSSLLKKISYRPFDDHYIYYDTKLIERSRNSLMKHLINGRNIALTSIRINKERDFSGIFITNNLADARLSDRFLTSIFPLYLYNETNNQTAIDNQPERIPNLNMEIVNKIAESAWLHFSAEENPEGATVETNQFHPIDLLDYIYAVLHSPSYREKYKEFLKIDFPRVPYPTNPKYFYDLVDLGSQLRKLHLLESEETEKYITQYPIDGTNEVIKPLYNDGKVYINETQYFDNVPQVAWSFYIGGYQPAQKWLKDRKGRVLEFDDILHYQKIIVALKRTSEIMIEIDKVLEV
ncbi:type ISP restriction/modification enzyme [Pedobacter sp. UYP24]